MLMAESHLEIEIPSGGFYVISVEETLNVERDTLADQYQFYACGDLLFAECSQETRDAFVKRIIAEHDHAQANGGRFRDGSRL